MQTTAGVKLSTEETQRMKRWTDEVEKALAEMAKVVKQSVGHQRNGKPGRFRRTFIREEGTAKIVFRDENGNCEGVWEDPPGICRLCGPED